MVERKKKLPHAWSDTGLNINSLSLTPEEQAERDKDPEEFDANMDAGKDMYND